MNIWHELIYTLRVIKKKLGFSALCVLVVALGFAITIPLYSLIKNFAYAPLPFPDGDKFVIVSQLDTQRNAELTTSSFDFFQFSQIRDSVTGLRALTAYRDVTATFSDGGTAEIFAAGRISADSFSLTAVEPLLGRTLLPADELPGSEPVVLLGYELWRNYYAGREDIVGSLSRLNGEAHTIVGVMPEGYKYPQSTEAWLPITVPATAEPGMQPRISLIGVLAEGVSRTQASAELAAITERLSLEFPDYYSDRSAKVIPFTHGLFMGAFTFFNSMAVLALCIFVLVCLNVSNLLLIRANERINELAIRTAVGASRLSLMFNVLLESLLVCVAGAASGFLLASVVLNIVDSLFYNLIPGGRAVPFWFDFGYTLDVIAVATALMLALWFFSGIFAAWRATRKDIAVTLGSDSRGSLSVASSRVTKTLVHFQIIISFFLLLLSGVFVLEMRSLYSVVYVDDAASYFTGTIDLAETAYSDATAQQNYRQGLQQSLLEISEVEDVTFSTEIPGEGGRGFVVSMETNEASPEQDIPYSGVVWVEPDYFQSVEGYQLQQGRYFDSNDNAESEKVVIVDDFFLRQNQIDETPLGQRVFIRSGNGQEGELARIVGVIPRKQLGGEPMPGESRAIVFRPISQEAPAIFRLIVHTRSNSVISASDLEMEIKNAAARVNRDISIYFISSLSADAESSNSLVRLFASMFSSVAVGALLLAVIGVYGLISRSVLARTSEIGIRRAVGSSNSLIARMFLGQGLFYLTMGVVFGGGIAALAISVLASSTSTPNLFPSFSIIFLSVTSVIGGLVCFASYVPVRKVIAMEPGEALHYE